VRDAGPLTIDGRTLGRWAFNGVAGGALVFVLLPLVFVTWLSFFQQEIPSFPPEGYSLKWFKAIWSNPKFVTGFVLSLQVAVFAMFAGLVLGVPAALCIARFRFPGREWLNSLLLLPLVVPGIVLGTSLYVFHVELQIVFDDVVILGSIAALIAGHILLVVPWCVRLVTASLAGFDRSVEEAALNLGATPTRAFFRVTLPIIRPGIVAAALFGFVVSFGNLEMTLFLVGAGRTTLPIAILQYLEWKIDPTIAAVSVLQISLIAAAMIVTDRFVKLSRVV
jgi:putative spermidine/putrescine transport system permease protein